MASSRKFIYPRGACRPAHQGLGEWLTPNQLLWLFRNSTRCCGRDDEIPLSVARRRKLRHATACAKKFLPLPVPETEK